MGPILFAGLIVAGLVLGTVLLQGFILLIGALFQLAIWIVWCAAALVASVWLAITDRPALARMWRDADPKPVRSPFQGLTSRPAPHNRTSWNL